MTSDTTLAAMSLTPTGSAPAPRIHHLKLGRQALTLIAQGKQTVEGRLQSAKMNAVRVGDVLCFNEGMLHCAVTRVTRYASMRDMVVAESPTALGEVDDIDAAVRSYEKIFWYPGAREKGMIAFAVRATDVPEGCQPTQLCLWPAAAQ